MRDLYSVLNLSRRASSKDIKAAYWALAKQFHPDLNAADMNAEQWIKAINHAYEILGNPDARAAYDLELAPARQGAANLLAFGSNRRSNLPTNGGRHLHGGNVEAARVEEQDRNAGCKSACTRARHSKVG